MKYIIPLLSVIIFFASISFAGELYVIQNIPIYAKSSNSSEARSKAISIGQKEAFYQLMDKMGEKTEIIDEDIAAIVHDYELSQELITSTSYKAVMRVAFNRDQSDRLFELLGISNDKIDVIEHFTQDNSLSQVAKNSTNPILVIPVLRNNGDIAIWSDSNAWLEAWKKNGLVMRESGYIVPVGDFDDINLTSDFNIMSAGFEDFGELMQKYNAAEVLLVVADYTTKSANFHKLEISIKKINEEGPGQYLQKFASLNGVSGVELYNLGIEKVIYGEVTNIGDLAMSNIQREEPSDASVKIKVPINKIGEWLEIEQRLSRSRLISGFMIKNMTTSSYYIAINFKKTFADLAKELMGLGLDLDEGQSTLSLDKRKK